MRSPANLTIFVSSAAFALGLAGCGSESGGTGTDGGAGADASAAAGTSGAAAGHGGKSGGAGTQDAAAGRGAAGTTGPGGSSGSFGTAGTGGSAGASGGGGGAAVGGGTDGGPADGGLLNAPTDLLATVTDRRGTTIHLSWTVPPSATGTPVASYQIRYGKIPITSTNFDDTAISIPIAYNGVPSAAGQVDGVDVKNLYIENEYYFAVAAADAAGNRSVIATTSGPGTGTCDCTSGRCCAARFNVATVSGTSGLPNEQFGIQFDGSGDVNGDGRSDILVGAGNGQHAYLFFGSNGAFNPTAPSVLFTGDDTTSSFGRSVAQIGDIDHDGREDIALASTGSQPPRIFIYKGRVNWPMAMGTADADYVIAGDSTYDGSSFGSSMARLGDFNGDGVDDFAAGAPGFTVGAFGVGRVVVVLGKTSFGGITLPDPTNTIIITGDSSLTFPVFGTVVLGLGHFYSVSTGTTLVVSAPGAAGRDSSSGRLFAFHGQAGSGGSIPLSSADNTFTGPAGNVGMGSNMANLGPMINGLPSLGTGQPSDAGTSPNAVGSAYLFSGNSGTGPFANRVMLLRPGAGKPGQAIFGGGISGRSAAFSILGDSRPDFGFISQTFSTLLILDGNVVGGLGAGPTDASMLAAATIKLPSGWINSGPGQGQLFPDVNGDGYPDFAVGSAVLTVPGSLAVYW
jgi:hypothetical protein